MREDRASGGFTGLSGRFSNMVHHLLNIYTNRYSDPIYPVLQATRNTSPGPRSAERFDMLRSTMGREQARVGASKDFEALDDIFPSRETVIRVTKTQHDPETVNDVLERRVLPMIDFGLAFAGATNPMTPPTHERVHAHLLPPGAKPAESGTEYVRGSVSAPPRASAWKRRYYKKKAFLMTQEELPEPVADERDELETQSLDILSDTQWVETEKPGQISLEMIFEKTLAEARSKEAPKAEESAEISLPVITPQEVLAPEVAVTREELPCVAATEEPLTEIHTEFHIEVPTVQVSPVKAPPVKLPSVEVRPIAVTAIEVKPTEVTPTEVPSVPVSPVQEEPVSVTSAQVAPVQEKSVKAAPVEVPLTPRPVKKSASKSVEKLEYYLEKSERETVTAPVSTAVRVSVPACKPASEMVATPAVSQPAKTPVKKDFSADEVELADGVYRDEASVRIMLASFRSLNRSMDQLLERYFSAEAGA